jgi:hypothetical protein
LLTYYVRHVLIDFRASKKEVKELLPNFVYVIYSDDYRKAILKRLGHDDDEVSLMGHEILADLDAPSVPGYVRPPAVVVFLDVSTDLVTCARLQISV